MHFIMPPKHPTNTHCENVSHYFAQRCMRIAYMKSWRQRLFSFGLHLNLHNTWTVEIGDDIIEQDLLTNDATLCYVLCAVSYLSCGFIKSLNSQIWIIKSIINSRSGDSSKKPAVLSMMAITFWTHSNTLERCKLYRNFSLTNVANATKSDSVVHVLGRWFMWTPFVICSSIIL